MSEYADDDDQRDIAASRGGDPTAFERLFKRHSSKVYGLALRMLRRDDQAEDVVQETFMQLHRKADSFRGDSKVSTWLSAIALNACRMRLRSGRRHALPLEDADAVPAAPEHVRGEALVGALDALEQAARELLLLAAQGFSYEELATLLGLSTDQIRGRLYRARKALLGQLEARGIDHV